MFSGEQGGREIWEGDTTMGVIISPSSDRMVSTVTETSIGLKEGQGESE